MTIEIAHSGKRVYEDNLKGKNSNKTEAKNENFSDILNTKLSNSEENSLNQIFERAGKKYNVPVDLLKSVAKAESNFNPTAVSQAGAQGIMQLMPSTAKGLGVINSFEPEQNIMGGAKYLSQMLDRFDGNVELSLAAYNSGPGNVIKYEGIPPFEETQNYVKKVMGYCGQQISSTYNAGALNSGINFVNQADALQQVLQNTDLSDIVNSNDMDSKDYALMMNLYRFNVQMSMLDIGMDNDIL